MLSLEPVDLKALPMFERTPLIVFALDVATFGSYSIYYAIRGRRLAELRLERPPTSYWSALWLLLPLVNIVVYVAMFNDLDRRTRAAGARPPAPLGVLAFVMCVISFLYKLPDPWWFVSLLSSVVLAAIHVPVSFAERRDDPTRRWAKLHWFEISLLVLGSVWYAAVAFAVVFGDVVRLPAAVPVAAGVTLALAVAAIFFGRIGVALVPARTPGALALDED